MLQYKKASMKGLTLVLIFILIIIGFQATGLTVGIDDSSLLKITYAEIKAMENAMNVRGIGGKIKIEILYDFRGEPTFLLGVSDSGYQIIERNNLMCIEGGEYNPYNGFSDNTKYYCGFLNYFVYSGDNYLNVRTNLKIKNLPRCNYLSEDANGFYSDRAFSPSASATASITYTKIIPHYESRIQRRAFGYNNDNTCSAVACTIVLDYLDYNNSSIVPSSFYLEALTSNNGSNVANNSPRAHAFHRFLVKNCGMGAVSYANGISYAIDRYRESTDSIKKSGIDCEWTLNIYTNFGINEINDNRPTMLTSTFAGEYSWHTMPVYGYRRYSDNALEWLVHTGWYQTLIYENGVYKMPKVWVAASTATYLYRFTYNGMGQT